MKQVLEDNGTTDMWQIACSYQLFHAAALMAMSSNDRVKPLAGKLAFAGTILFSGSIYFLSLEIGPKALLGPITPIGGSLMFSGWIVAGIPQSLPDDGYQESKQEEI